MSIEESRNIEFLSVGVYLLLMVGVGWAFRKFNRDVSDYFRSGCKGTWWLVGMSTFMTGFSAWTFTAAAGDVYLNGWSVLALFWSNVLGYLFNYFFLAARFRQLRAITVPEVISMRFGEFTRQFYAYNGFLGSVFAAIQLLALATFSAAVFGFNLQMVILVLGLVVVFYSTSGGKWAVMSTDFLQAIILIPVTILVAVLSLVHIGGVGELFTQIKAQGLTEDYKFVKDPGQLTGMKYTFFYIVAILFNQVINHNSMQIAPRYFAVKDGREAKRAALFTATIFFFGTLIWFLPPIVARLTMPELVESIGGSQPQEAAYAVISMKLLPAGLTGLVVVAMFTATMSSMDSGLNGKAAIIIKDIYPGLCHLFKKEPTTDDDKLLRYGRLITLCLGALIITIALHLSTLKHIPLFDLLMTLLGLLSTPMTAPLILGVFIKRVPNWAAMFSVCCGLVGSFLAYKSGDWDWLGEKWTFQRIVFTNFAVGATAFIATMPFYKGSSEKYRQRADYFFKLMNTPVDFAKEVGKANDYRQFGLIGTFAIIIGCLIALLVIVPETTRDRVIILGVAGIIAGLGGLFIYLSKKLNGDPDDRTS